MRRWTIRKSCMHITAACGSVMMVISMLAALLDRDEFALRLISQKITLKNGSSAMQMWIKAPFPVLFKIYFWNVTNPKEVSAGAKPILAEVGPYIYEQWLEKVNVKEEANDTLSYNANSNMFFSEKLTGRLTEADSITIIHLPIVAMVLRVDDVMPEYVSYLEGIWSELFPGTEDIFLTATVRDLLFDGIPIDCTSKDFMVTTACNNLESDLPKTIRKVGNKAFKFSFFNYKKEVSSDIMRVYRGIQNISQLGQIHSFNNEVSLKKWHNKYCDMVNGTDGSQLPVRLKPSDTVYLFQPDFCRSLYAKYEKEVYKEKIRLFRFINTPDLLASPEINPNNECFCAPKAKLSDFLGEAEEENGTAEEEARTCMESGALLLTPCLGAPVVITFPHFYLGDSSFSDYVPMSPSKELHESLVDVEPLSGIPFFAKKRIQFNVQVKPIPDMAMMANLAAGLFPILWVEESMELPEELYSQLSVLLTLHSYVNTIGFVGVGIASIFLISAGVCYAKDNKAVTWGMDAGEVGNGQVMHGLYPNRAKLPFNVSDSNPGKPPPEYPMLTKRTGGWVYPNPTGVYRENFM